MAILVTQSFVARALHENVHLILYGMGIPAHPARGELSAALRDALGRQAASSADAQAAALGGATCPGAAVALAPVAEAAWCDAGVSTPSQTLAAAREATTASAPAEPPRHRPTAALPDLLSALASAACHITADGQLPPHALESAAAAARQVLELGVVGEEWAAELRAPSASTGVMQLLSLAVRKLADAPALQPAGRASASRGPGSGDWEQWRLVFQGCMRLLAVSIRTPLSTPTATGEVVTYELERNWMTALVSAMLQTDLMPALSRLAAAATQAATAAAAAVPSDLSSGADAVGGGGGRWREEQLLAWPDIVRSTCGLLDAWWDAEDFGDGDGDVPDWPPMCAQLMQAVQDCRLLDHTARALLALLAACGACGGGSDAGWPREMQEGLVDACTRLLEAVSSRTWRGDTSPCLQHLLLLHTVAQLCAVDGGSSYGLPPGAGLPAITQDRKPCWPSSSPGAETGGGGSGGGDGSPGGRGVTGPTAGAVSGSRGLNSASAGSLDSLVPLHSYYCRYALQIWADGAASRGLPLPCSRRALWALSMRLAAAAEASWQADGATGHPIVPLSLFSEPGDLALQALQLAMALAGGEPAVGDTAQLWSQAVRTARGVVTSCGMSALEATSFLLRLRLGRMRLGPSLPPEPPPDVAAALASGYVGCVEMLLRRSASGHGEPQGIAETCLLTFATLVRQCRRMPQLLAYGEPRALASAITTAIKVLRRGLAEAAVPASASAMRSAGLDVARDAPGGMTTAALCERVGCQGLSDALTWFTGVVQVVLGGRDSHGLDDAAAGPEDRHWWCGQTVEAKSAPRGWGDAVGRHEGGSAVCNDSSIAGEAASGADGSGSGDIPGGGSRGSSGTPGGRLPPFHQLLLLLASWTLSQWLPALSRGALALSDTRLAVSITSGGVLPWVPPLVLAYLDCRAAAVEAAVEAARSGAGGATGAAAAAEAAARSWRQLLLRDMQLPRLIAELLPRTSVRPSLFLMDGPDVVISAVLHLAVAFPDEARPLLQAPEGDPPGGTLLQGMHVFGERPECVAVRFLTQVAAMVTAGRRPSAGMIARLRSGDYRSGSGGSGHGGSQAASKDERWRLLSAPQLLPPPCVAAAMLALPLCANPGCVNLAGDREAGLRLSGCRRCGGAVSYCSEECRAAHWDAGHRGECGAAGG